MKMGSCETWSLTSKICDSCKMTPALVFCRADSAFLCVTCDSRVHTANKLASRHARVWVCEVCEQAPAAVTCKADAAALCVACDDHIHSANPLSRRHQRLPVVPFHGAAADSATKSSADDFPQEEAEAASWLLTNQNVKLDEGSGWSRYRSQEYLFGDPGPFLDLDLISVEQKPKRVAEQKEYSCDGVVPVQPKNEFESGQFMCPAADGFPTHNVKFPIYNFTSRSMSQSVSSSSLETVVLPDYNSATAIPIHGMDRKARVLRYREKRNSRKFGKTIRYASRKSYAEKRPRIKGRFAKRLELEVDSLISYDDASSFCTCSPQATF